MQASRAWILIVAGCSLLAACERPGNITGPMTSPPAVPIAPGTRNALSGLQVTLAGPPIAVPDNYVTPIGVALVIAAPGTLANDFDPDGDSFQVTSITQPVHGTLTSAVTNGAFTYVPPAGFTGTDSFTYLLRDAKGDVSAPGTVTITVIPDPNRAPVAIDDAFATPAGTPLVISAPGTLANDYDPDANAILMNSITQPSNGTLTSAVTNGAFTYVPNPGFTGNDSFTYLLRDANGALSASGTVHISVYAPGGTNPVAVPDMFATAAGVALTIAAPGTLANDYDPDGSAFQMVSITQPTNGELTSAVTNGAFTYVPDPGFTGDDSFTYTLRDSDNNLSTSGTVTIRVYPAPNRPPVAIADVYATPVNTTLTIAAPGTLANDYDPDGTSFSMNSITPPAHGVLTSAVTNGAFTYVPNAGFFGTDSFTYLLRDANGAVSASGTVTIWVVPPPDLSPPQIVVASTLVLLPPDGRYRTLSVADLVSAVTDNRDLLTPSAVVITRVTSDEDRDVGRPGADIVIATNCKAVDLRASRNGNGNGRVYVVELAVTDAGGNTGTASIEVHVPKAPPKPAIKDAQVHVVQGGCQP